MHPKYDGVDLKRYQKMSLRRLAVRLENLSVKIAEKEHLGRINIFFLNAERQGPRLISNINNVVSFSVGNFGENTNYIIGKLDKNQELNGNNDQRIYFSWGRAEINNHQLIMISIEPHWEK